MTSASPLGRFVEISPEEMTAEQRDLVSLMMNGARGRVPTPYKLWINSPDFARRMEQLGDYLVRESSFSPREVEIAVLVIARQLKSEFVISAHRRIAATVGLQADIIEALCAGNTPMLSDDRERNIFELSSALSANAVVDDALFDRSVATIGHVGIAELTGLLGFYCACGFVLRCYQVPPLAAN